MTPTGSTFVRVVWSGPGGWDVNEPGGSRALCRAETQLEAARRAVRVLSPVGGQIRVLDTEGRLVRSIDVRPEPDAKRWWYLRNWGQFLVVSGLLLASGVANLINDHARPLLLLAVLQVIGCALIMVCALASRGRRRAAMQAATEVVERELAQS